MLWFCATAAWSSFPGLITQATSERASLRDSLVFGIAIFAGVNAVRKSGLLALANHDPGPQPI